MAEEKGPEIIRKAVRTSWQPDVGEVSKTWVTFRDEIGRMDLVIVPGTDPTDKEIAEAIKKRREEAEKRKPYRIPL